MSLALSWALSVSTGAQAGPCNVPVTFQGAQSVPIRLAGCCEDGFAVSMPQGGYKVFTFIDLPARDYSTATEITFDAWNDGASVASYSLTGGDITQPANNHIALTIPSDDSAAFPLGRLDAEIWVTFADGSRIGATGVFTVTAPAAFTACILQGEDKAFTFSDANETDFSTVTEATFVVTSGGSDVLSFSISGGEITQITEHQFAFAIPNDAGLPSGELGATFTLTLASGATAGLTGVLSVEDTRKFD